jgi:NitT/TauT family transport system ATP-binding protein
MAGTAINIARLDKVFRAKSGPVTALEGIDLAIGEREFVALIGPSGCGKSTLLRILAGLTTATAGGVRLHGETITRPHPYVGMVFQSYASFPWLTVRQNVRFGPDLHGVPRSDSEPMVRDILDRLGLAKFADAYPTELSGGMQQRVAIGRTLANEPAVLLMDEPFGALDALTRVDMQELILRLWQDQRKTVVFVTHDIDEAIYLADRIVVLSPHPGRVHEIRPVDIPRPRTPEVAQTRAFIDLHMYLRDMLFAMKHRSEQTA